MSEINLKHESMLTAVAVIREVAGPVPEIDTEGALQPFLVRVWEAAGGPDDGVDTSEAFMTLITSLSQIAGSAIQEVLKSSLGHEPSLEEMLDYLLEMQLGLQAQEEAGHGY